MDEREGSVGMHAAPNRCAELTEVLDSALGQVVGEWSERRRPMLGARVARGLELCREAGQPAPAVQPLERLVALCLEVAQLAREQRLGEVRAQATANRLRFRHVGESLEQPQERPVTMHRGVPVKTAEERRRQLVGWKDRVLAIDDVSGLVRVFPIEARER